MNTKTLVAIVGAVIIVIGGYIAYRVLSSRPLSPKQTTTYSYHGLDLKVIYCRPFKRGRLIFGDSTSKALVPYGKYWRLGANESTEITFSKDVKVNGQDLKSGSYRLYAVPGETSWKISFNSELATWGYNEPNHDLDVLSVEITADRSVGTEEFTISFAGDAAGVNMNIDWDKTHLRVPISI
jgi:hypothetical protein